MPRGRDDRRKWTGGAMGAFYEAGPVNKVRIGVFTRRGGTCEAARAGYCASVRIVESGGVRGWV